jgi:hypothetical protein
MPRRSRWREVEYMFREISAAILPANGLVKTLSNWPEIAKRLAESRRRRKRFSIK